MEKNKQILLTLIFLLLYSFFVSADVLSEKILQGQIISINPEKICIKVEGENTFIYFNLKQDAVLKQNGINKSWKAFNPVYPGAYQDACIYVSCGGVSKVDAFYRTIEVRFIKKTAKGLQVQYLEGKKKKVLLSTAETIKIFPSGELLTINELFLEKGQVVLLVLGINNRIIGMDID